MLRVFPLAVAGVIGLGGICFAQTETTQPVVPTEDAIVAIERDLVQTLQERTTIILDTGTAPFNLFDFDPDTRADAHDGSEVPLALVP